MSNNHFAKTGKVTIGTRASELALAQAQEIKELLKKTSNLQENQIKIVKITTSGDKIQDVSLADIGGKGLFIKELEEQLISKKIDIAVHSAKDVPPDVHLDTEIAAFSQRRDARDYFISNDHESIAKLPRGATLGTSSARRKAILLKMRPDLDVVNFRGNVNTRLKKIEENQVDATILAVCGLKRIGKKINGKHAISVQEMLPAVGQGCLALQTRKDDPEIREIVRKINHLQSEICVAAERSFLRVLKASCKSPIAVYCQIEGKKLHFRGQIFDFDGKEDYKVEFYDKIDELLTDFDKNQQKIHQKAQNLAKKAAKEVKDQAKYLLAKICQ